MQHPDITIQSDDDDDVVSIDGNDLGRPMFKMPTGITGPSLGTDLLINKQKVSSDVLSISSGRSKSSSGSEYTTDESDAESLPRPRMNMMSSRSASSSSGYTTSDDDDGSTQIIEDDDDGKKPMSRFASERSRAESELQEKKEILYQMDRLEAKGYRLPRKFTLQSDIEEMRIEFNRVVREKEVDASIRFQRKMMMALVTGVEYLNTRFDPFDIRLNGWSEQVHDNINDYDDIFEELHDKYKGSGKKMAPELRLLMSLSGSAFMFHFTNSMFKQSNVPHVEDVLRSDPNLMKQFQRAAVNRMAESQPPTMNGNPGGIFGMMSNLFSPVTKTAPVPNVSPMPPQQPKMQGPRNVEDIINVVSEDINNAKAARYETLSVSDEEITSIIEDTADLNGLMGGTAKRRGGGRRGPAPANTGGRRTLQL